MAADAQNKNLFGASPVTLVVGGVGVVAIVVLLLFPGLLGGPPPDGGTSGATDNSGAGTATVATNPTAVAPAPPAAAPTAQGALPGEAVRAVDPFASFVVRFGRKNPFSALPGRTGTVSSSAARSSAAPPSTGTTTGDLAKRLEELKASTGAGPAAGAMAQLTKETEGYLLTGIVRVKTMAIAVIRHIQRQDPYIVAVGDRLEKSPYTVVSIGDDRATIASDERQIVLFLGGKKS
ncbi:MAG: hypothetical protein ACM3XS_01930 [Bacteroidota bacterium]